MTEIKAQGDTRKLSSVRPLKGGESAKLTRAATFDFLLSLALQAGVVGYSYRVGLDSTYTALSTSGLKLRH